MYKILQSCLGSRYLKWLALVAVVAVLGLLAWGVAPRLVLSALPLLGLAACLLPCLLPIWWLRRSNKSPAVPVAPGAPERDEQPGRP